MKKLNDWITYFLPGNAYVDEETYRLHRLFVIVSLITSPFALGYCLMSIYLKGYLFAVAMIISSVLFILLPFLLRWGAKLAVLANMYVGIIAVVYVFLVYWGGGIKVADVAPWVVMLPAMALLLQGLRTAVVWLLLSLIVIGIFSVFHYQGIAFPIRFDISKGPLFTTLSLSGLVCIISAIIFITEREKRAALGKLESQNRALEKLNQEKNSFLSLVAHDLKNPLASVRTFAEASNSPQITTEKRQRYLQNIALASDRMFELVKNILDVNLIESGKINLNLSTVNLNILITDYCDQIKPLAEAKAIDLVVELPQEQLTLRTDQGRLLQILENYVSNAIKYCPPDSKACVKLKGNGDTIEISVTDSGPGIPKEELAGLFTPYGITSSMPRAGENKTGLGLAIVKKIADALNAEVGYNSNCEKGSEFFLRFRTLQS